MRKTWIVSGIAILALALFSFGCSQQHRGIISGAVTLSVGGAPVHSIPAVALPAGLVSAVFVESSDGTDDGVVRLIQSMRNHGLEFYQTQAAPNGLIASGDVVLLKINAQWDQRGGTNTDLIRATIREILNHPEGFTGEIIVADNGQAQFGSAPGGGGSLNWARNNAVDQTQSTLRVIRDFQAMGYRVTGVLWDEFTRIRVQEFNTGDMRNGFVVENTVRSTGIAISYPKFTTEFGTMVSFRYGIWDSATQTYNSDILKVINMPVLKSHSLFQVTAAVKNYMGVPSDWLTRQIQGGRGRAHNSVGTGGMGTLMVYTRMPILNITDMIWIGPDRGPRVDFHAAVQTNKIAASTDAFALDYWTARYVLIPQAARVPGGRSAAMNPAGMQPGTFGHWMRLSMAELHRAGIPATMNPAEMLVVQSGNVL
ncbi:MAG: DUF362 domain-containing protein [Treponema sp.]|jgi:uncharacterized protein (DUF362 family)|nr:DUF362 domain-containing protein [Treponema sp.]